MADRCAHSETLPNQQEPPHAGLSLPAYENTLSIPPDDRFFSPPIIEMILTSFIDAVLYGAPRGGVLGGIDGHRNPDGAIGKRNNRFEGDGIVLGMGVATGKIAK